MATATFDRTFIVEDQDAQDRLKKFMDSEQKIVPLSVPPITNEELKKNGDLLKECLFH